MIRIAPDLAWELLDDGGLMVCPLKGGDLLELSTPAGLLWTWIVDGVTLEHLAQQLTDELGVDGNEAEDQARAFCQALRERDLLQH
jgi:hypothetical protein